MVSPVGEGEQLVDELHVHSLQLGRHLQHVVVQIVGEAQIVVVARIALLARHEHFASDKVGVGEHLGLQEFDWEASADLSKMIKIKIKRFILFHIFPY